MSLDSLGFGLPVGERLDEAEETRILVKITGKGNGNADRYNLLPGNKEV